MLHLELLTLTTQLNNNLGELKYTPLSQGASELNITDGLTATTTELNQLDDKVVGGSENDDIVDVGSSQTLQNKTLDGGTFIQEIKNEG